MSDVVVLNKAAAPTLTGALHPDHGLYIPSSLHQMFCFTALQWAPIWTALALFLHSFSSWTNVLYMPESLNVSQWSATLTEIQNWTLEKCWVLAGLWQKTEFLFLNSFYQKTVMHQIKYVSAFIEVLKIRLTAWHMPFFLPVFPDEEWTRPGIFNCLIRYCSLRN